MATFSNKSKNIAFFVKEFSGKPLEAGGTDNIIYQYAKYNEEILNNKSYIICLNKQTLSTEFGIEDKRTTFTTFNSRFKMIEIKFIEAITDLIDRFHFDIFYTLDSGLDSVMHGFLRVSRQGYLEGFVKLYIIVCMILQNLFMLISRWL